MITNILTNPTDKIKTLDLTKLVTKPKTKQFYTLNTHFKENKDKFKYVPQALKKDEHIAFLNINAILDSNKDKNASEIANAITEKLKFDAKGNSILGNIVDAGTSALLNSEGIPEIRTYTIY
jgi:hypothetical protein